ncbi:MAG TPA: S-layer homology domain-containing protein [Clostridia bacterium]
MIKKFIVLLVLLSFVVNGLAYADTGLFRLPEPGKTTLLDKLGIMAESGKVTGIPPSEDLNYDEIKIDNDTYADSNAYVQGLTNKGIKALKPGDEVKLYYNIVRGKKNILFVQTRQEFTNTDVSAFLDEIFGLPFYDGGYKPERNLSRASFIQLAISADGYRNEKSDRKNEVSCFKDVTKNDWYNGCVNAAKKHELINGYSDMNFKPNELITYDDVIVIIIRMLGYETEVKGSNPYTKGYLDLADKLGITKGIERSPGEPITFATALRMLYNAMSVKLME